MQLTTRQRQILDFIEAQMRDEGMPPTRAEIVKHFGFASPNAAQCHLRTLAERGAIELRAGTARGIIPRRLSSARRADNQPSLHLPLIGRVAAGTPLLAIESRERELRIDADLFWPRPDYALTVQGDSMIGAGVENGDLLLVHRTPEAASGQIVVARLDDEVTVKRLRRRGRGVFLEPDNPDFSIIHVAPDREFAIEGLAVGTIRRYSAPGI